MRQSQLDADLEKFYARMGIDPSKAAVPPRSPLDMPTVSLEEIASAVDWPGAEDMDFQGELLPILRKRLIWDIVPDPKIRKFSPRMGVTPGSEEGDVVEATDSHRRRQNLLPLMPLVQIAAWTAGEVTSRAKMLDSSDDVSSVGDVLVLGGEHDVIAEVTQATMAVIANLIEMEILTYGRAVTGDE